LAAQPSRLISSQELLSLDRLCSEVAQDSDELPAYNAGIRYVLLRALRASQERSPTSMKPVHPAVGRAVRLLRENGSADSLSELARAAGVTPHYLSRLLTEQTGRNFVDWRNRVRLDRFIESYRPGANLLAAALEAGFGSYSRFHHTFTELVGCTPKDWVAQVDAGKLAPRAEASAPASGFGLHGSGTLLSPRQRWGSVTPLVSSWIRDLVGDGFAHRLAEALPTDHGPEWLLVDEQALSFTSAEIEDFVASFHHQDPELAAQYGRLVRPKDNLEIYTRFCEAYVAPPALISTSLLMLVVFAWASVRTETMALQPIAVRRQIAGALRQAPRPPPETLRRGFIAAVCHFGVLREATVAAQAGGEPRAPDQLGRAISRWSEAVFDGDVRLLEMTKDGLRPPVGAESVRPRLGYVSQAAAT
jgi:AraC-like DNA-binding protein